MTKIESLSTRATRFRAIPGYLQETVKPLRGRRGQRGTVKKGLQRLAREAAKPRLETPRLLCGCVLFDRVRVLEPRELHGEPFLQVAHHPSRDLSERDVAADLGPMVGRDTGAGE